MEDDTEITEDETSLLNAYRSGQEEEDPSPYALQALYKTQNSASNVTTEEDDDEDDLDPFLMKALEHQESRGNQSAISPAGAVGIRQIMPSTFKEWAKPGEEITDEDDNKAVGDRYFKYLLKHYDGDTELALAAYNGGFDRIDKLLKRTGGTTFDDIKDKLVTETREYVPSVMKHYRKFQGEDDSEDTPTETPQAPLAFKVNPDAPATIKGLAEEFSRLTSMPEFATMPFKERSQEFYKIYNSKKYWGKGANNIYRKLTSYLWDGADPDDLPDMNMFGTPPITPSDEDPKKATEVWKNRVLSDLSKQKITPAVFGGRLEDYLDQASKEEIEAYTARNRSWVGGGANNAANMAGDLVKGAVTNLTFPVAAVARLTNNSELADKISALPESMYTASNDYLYQTDALTGRVLFNEDGTPKTRVMHEAAQVIGQMSGLLLGGVGLTRAGWSGGRLLLQYFVPMNVLGYAGDSFKEVYDSTNGDLWKSYKGAMFSLPAAAVDSLGDMGVIGKLGKGLINGLGKYNKAKYVALMIAKGAASEGVSELAGDTIAQAGEISQTGKPWNELRSKKALIYGALGGGLFSGGMAVLDPGAVPPPQMSPSEVITEDKPAESPPPETPVEYNPTSEEEQAAITAKLEAFQKSEANSSVWTEAQIAQIPPEVFTHVLDMEVTQAEDNKVLVTKKETYIQQDSENIEGLNNTISGLQKNLELSPSPDNLDGAVARIQYLKKQIFEQTKSSSRANVEAMSQRRELQQRIDALKAEKEAQTDPILKRVAHLELLEAETAVSDFDSANEDVYTSYEKVNALQNELDILTQARDAAISTPYINDTIAKQRNLKNLIRKRNNLIAKEQAKTQEVAEISNGIPVDDNTILPVNSKWYIVDPSGHIERAGHTYYKDAFDSLKPIPIIELPADFSDIIAAPKKATSVKESRVPENIASEITALTVDELGGETVESRQTKAEKEAEKEDEARAAIPTTRRRITSNKKPLTSNYTPMLEFAGTGTKLVKAKEITKAATKLINSFDKNIAVFEGARTPPKVAAYFNFVRQFISVGRFNDPMSLLHELKHVVDKRFVGHWTPLGVGDYSKLPASVLEAAKDMADTFYGEALTSDNRRIQEGLALFYQHYASGQPYRTEMGEWYHGQFAGENPKVYEALEDIKVLTHEYYNQTSENFARSLNEKRPKPTIEATKRYFTTTNLYDEWGSKAGILRDIENTTGDFSLRKMWDADYRASSDVAEHMIKKGMMDLDKNVLEDQMSYVEAIAPAKGYEEKFDAYLNASRAQAAYHPQGLQSGMNREDANNIIVDVLLNYPNVALAAENHWAFFDNINSMVERSSEAGRFFIQNLKKRNLEATGKEHGYYLPQPREGKGRSNSLVKLTGSTRSKVDPLSHIQDSVEDMLRLAYTNRFKEALAKVASDPSPSGVGAYMHEVTGMERRGLVETLNKLGEAEENSGIEARAIDRHLYAYKMGSFDSPKGGSLKILPILDKSGVRFFEVDARIPRLLADTLPDIMNNPLFRFASIGAKVLRPMATTFSPVFQLKQNIHDPLSATRFLMSQNANFGEVLSLYKDIAVNLATLPLYHFNIYKSGWIGMSDRLGIANSNRVAVTGDIRKQLSRQFGDNVLDMSSATFAKFESALSVPETANRIAVAKFMMRRMGVTDPNQKLTTGQYIEIVAAFKRGTTNFQDQGYSAQVVNAQTPFFTARIAELTRLPSDYRGNKKGMAAYVAAVLGASIAYGLAYKDDEWYQELDDPGKMQNIVFGIDIGGIEKALYLPLDTLSSIPWGIGQAIVTKINEDPLAPNSLYDLAKSYFGGYAPIKSAAEFLTPIGKEITQQANNYDYFFDRPIVPPSLDFGSPELQVNQYTTELAKRVGAVMGWSPIRVDHAIRSIAPAAGNALNYGDRLFGYKQSKEAQVNLLVSALSKAGTRSAIMEKTHRAFQNYLMDFRENKILEDSKQKIIREKLERINQTVSDLSTFIIGTDNAEDSKALNIKKRELLHKGLEIVNGSRDYIPPSKYHAEALKLRKKRLADIRKGVLLRAKELELKGSEAQE